MEEQIELGNREIIFFWFFYARWNMDKNKGNPTQIELAVERNG